MNPTRTSRSDLAIGHLDPVAIAATYQCGHCDSDPPTLNRDSGGVWHIHIGHDDTCPVLAGALPALPDLTRAVR